MQTRLRVALVAAVSVICCPCAAQAQARTEQEIIDLIVREGPQALAIRAAAEIAPAEQAARAAFPNPSFAYAREGAGFTEFYQFEQVLPAFGARDALHKVGGAARETAEAERDARLWQLRIDARMALARWRSASERLDAARSVEKLVEQLVGVLRTREREGEGSRYDRVRAEQELVDVRLVATSAEVDGLTARAILASMLPASASLPDSVVPPAPAIEQAPAETLVQRARSGRADLRALDSQARRFALEAEASQRLAGPALSLSGGVKRAEGIAETQSGGVIGASLTLPLFNRGSLDLARWSAERTRIEFERLAAEAAVRAEITSTAAAVILRTQAANRARDAQTVADELITIAVVAYREGEVGIIELLDAYRTMGRARERAIGSALDLRLGEIALERAVGVTLWP